MIVEFNSNLQLENPGIIQILSAGRKSSGLSSSMLHRLELLKKEAKNYMHPLSIYDYFPTKELPDLPYFKEAELVGLSICTIGEELPKRVKNLFAKGKLVDGSILDAIGSIAAEEVANKVNGIISKYALEINMENTLRYSPGYCSWLLSGQSVIFNKLQSSKIGVELTESFLMLPIKSVSFAINIGFQVNRSKWENRCRMCKKICSYRRNEYDKKTSIKNIR